MLDIAPIYSDDEHITGYAESPSSNFEHTVPKTKNSTDYYSHIMLKPSNPDFRVSNYPNIPD